MALEVVFRPKAEEDLASLYLCIAETSGAVIAVNFIERIEAACLSLADFPNRGLRRDDLAPGLRTTSLERRVTIAYQVLKTRVEIVTIAYGGRDFESELRDERDA